MSVFDRRARLDSSNGLRATFARLIGADSSCIALTDSVSRASNIAIRVLAAGRGGNVVVDESTYPSSLYPWYAQERIAVRMVSTEGIADPASALAEQIDEDTVAVCISHVSFTTGRRHPLASIAAAARTHAAVLVVDAAQSAGVVPIDVAQDGVDVLVTTSMKWLMGPPGVALMYMAPAILGRAPVLDVGYLGFGGPVSDLPRDRMPDLAPDARRFDLGMPNLPGLAAAKAGIDLVQEVGVRSIFARVEELTTRCLRGLDELGAEVVTPVQPNQRAGIIVVRHPDPEAVVASCRQAGIDIGSIGCLRIDVHAFNDEQDVDRLLDRLAGTRAIGPQR
jgi:selenocysteine lyase/cysteine desulfurase